LLACDPINPLLAISIETKPDSTHGRKINTVSPEKNLDEREKEKDTGRRQQQIDHI
jgi:hypothetical protein